uniref:C2H2-type domain-containing protein n=1 Tax=Clastoptera arizonana TaxID=38151 RepID=A0A1B6EH30_9HEMI
MNNNNKTRDISTEGYKENCLWELQTLYHQLQDLRYRNKLKQEKRITVNNHILEKNKKLQILIRKRINAVNKLIVEMKAKDGKQKNRLTSDQTPNITDIGIPKGYSTYSRKKSIKPVIKNPEFEVDTRFKETSVETKNVSTATETTLKDDSTQTDNKEKNKDDKDNVSYYDPEIHWCQRCNMFPQKLLDFLNHLHSNKHRNLVLENKAAESLWIVNEIDKYLECTSKEVPVTFKPIKGLQFIVPVEAFYCKLCSKWLEDIDCANNHLRTCFHDDKYNDYLKTNPQWEVDWMLKRSLALNRIISSKDELERDYGESNKSAVRLKTEKKYEISCSNNRRKRSITNNSDAGSSYNKHSHSPRNVCRKKEKMDRRNYNNSNERLGSSREIKKPYKKHYNQYSKRKDYSYDKRVFNHKNTKDYLLQKRIEYERCDFDDDFKPVSLNRDDKKKNIMRRENNRNISNHMILKQKSAMNSKSDGECSSSSEEEKKTFKLCAIGINLVDLHKPLFNNVKYNWDIYENSVVAGLLNDLQFLPTDKSNNILFSWNSCIGKLVAKCNILNTNNHKFIETKNLNDWIKKEITSSDEKVLEG